MLKAQSVSAPMSALDINYALRKQGLNQSIIARTLSVSPSVVSSVISGRASSFVVATYIAQRLGSDINELWPNKYVFKPRSDKKCSQNESR